MKARAGTVLLLSRHAAYVGIRIAYVSIRIAYVKACGWNGAPVKPLTHHICRHAFEARAAYTLTLNPNP